MMFLKNLKMFKIYSLTLYNYKFLLHNLSNLYSVIFFFILISSLFPICLGSDLIILSQISLGLLWSVLLLIVLTVSNNLLQKEIYYYQIPIYMNKKSHFHKFLIAKWISFWLFFIFPILLMTPLFFLLFGLVIQINQLIKILFILIVSTLPVSYLTLISSLILIVIKKNDSLVSFFFIPAYYPILIFSINNLENVLNQDFHLFPFFCLIFLSIFSFFFITFLSFKFIQNLYID